MRLSPPLSYPTRISCTSDTRNRRKRVSEVHEIALLELAGG